MSTTVTEFTVSEQILLAADQLDRQGHASFSAEALVVASWQQFPRTFGLKGYFEQYPDSNKVLSSLMGEKGLARRGWLIKVDKKMYALTRDGRRVLARLLKQEQEEPLPSNTIKLSREQERFLLNLLESSAVHKFEENRKQELTSADAWRFWDITQNLRGEAVDERLKMFETMLHGLDRELALADAELSNGRVLSAGDLRVLHNIHRYMADRFVQHLNLLRNRSERQ